MRAWRWCALSVPAAMVLAGCGWLWVLAGSAAAAVIGAMQEALLRRCGTRLSEAAAAAFGSAGAKLCAAAALLWTLLAAAGTATACQAAFEADLGPLSPAVPLLLALLACRKGPAIAARACTVAAMIAAGLYAVVIVSSLRHIEPAWCAPWGDVRGGAQALLLGLTPACALWFEETEESGCGWGEFARRALFAPLLAFLTAACLPPQLTAQERLPLYTLTKSLSVLSVMQRFEVLLSVAEMLGVTALLCMLVCAAVRLAAVLWPQMAEDTAAGGFCAAAFLLSFAAAGVPMAVWAVGCGIFWGVLPILTLVIVDIKKIQKF